MTERTSRLRSPFWAVRRLAALRLVPGIALALAALATRCVSGPGRAGPRWNVLLLTADSLRADRVDTSDTTANGRTPNLARLARRGTVFNRAYTVTPWTAPSVVSILTGLYPATHGVVNRDDTTPRAVPTLPRLLAARGYALANFGFFTAVSYYRNLGLPAQAIDGAEQIGSQILAGWLGTAPEPFFAWIHYVEPHLPYGAGGYEAATVRVRGSSGLERAQVSATVPLGGGYAFEPGDREKLLALYDRDVRQMDDDIGKVLDALAARGLEGRTLVLFTADHGEELLDHGWVGHASTSGEATLADEVVRIPLVIAGPGVPAGAVREALAQNVDVTPTLLDLAGVPKPKGIQGLSLAPALSGGTPRRLVFFDTSPGGHLTPESRRNERLQGVSDGTRMWVDRTGGPAQPADAAGARDPSLAPALAGFRDEQARKHLKFLAAYGGVVRPDRVAVDTWAEGLEVASPAAGARLSWREAGGSIRLDWNAVRREGASFWIEYEVGSGLLSAKGAFPIEETSVSFGPFPAAFWNDLAGYSPFRFRVLDPSGKRRSAWRAFSLLKDAAQP